ncbi:hypothetical protein C2E21_6535 [Chlorella sorokiniana]|uniref:Uncharacterized protein n=1 Tax=Chlorella sorokiniana TaxID=3076 RepID=A0A2P6TKC7_CHLSO|nr:hypothetical protein C2E21_6535 [Chlorella sorokiniana]|eukprot:PRW44521.1 hypothetical protein C2E21_6535 [Chlorella sorokiniana]
MCATSQSSSDDGQLLECAACEKDGELLRCCGCPHAFHPECAGYAGFDDVPVARSRWHCWYCAGAKGFKHPTSKLAVKAGGKLLVGYTNECQVYYLGEAVEVTCEQVAVRFPHFPASEVERLPRTSKRLWHGTLADSSWQFDKADFSYEPLSRCAPVDFDRLREELAARQAAAAAAAAAAPAPAAAAGTPRAKGGVTAAAAAAAGSVQQGATSAGNSFTSSQLSGPRPPSAPWSQAEEDALLDAVRHLGVGKWQRVKDLKAAQLSGRSVEEIRAKWRSGLKQTSVVSPTRARLPFPSPWAQAGLGAAPPASAAAAGPAAAGPAAAEASDGNVPAPTAAAAAAAAAAATAAAVPAAPAVAAAEAAVGPAAASEEAEWKHPSAFPRALTVRLRPTPAALALHPGQLVEARAVEEDFCGGWALARVLQVHRGGSAGIASVDVEYCDFREEGEATNTRERVSFLHTTDDRRWVFPRIRLPRLPTKPTGAWPPALQQEQIVEVFVHDIWWWGEVVRLEEQAGVAGVRFEPPPLGEGDLTSHPLYNLRLNCIHLR